MTQYVNEFDPTKATGFNSVQEDDKKLKFNNILSCIAVCLVPADQGKMIGVHFTFMNTRAKDQIKNALRKMVEKGGVSKGASVYLISAFGHHSNSALLSELKKLTKNIFLCDIPPDERTNAAVDVKFQKNGRVIQGWIRPCVVIKKDRDGAQIPKMKSDSMPFSSAEMTARWKLGKNNFQTDRDEKPWVPAIFTKV